MSEKRPETSADILTRSQVLSDTALRRDAARRRFTTSTKPGAKRYKVDLAAHMAECDANFRRLQQLLPQMRSPEHPVTRVLLADRPVEVSPYVVFEVVEQGPYTTTLKITLSTTLDVKDVGSDGRVANSDEGEFPWMALAAAPQMTVRVYHDAQSAEIVSYQNQTRFHGIYEYPNQRMRQPDEKIQLNRFLGEFLSLCLHHGAMPQPISISAG